MKWRIVVVFALATGTAAAERPAVKGAANAAELWLRYLGPASDVARARAMTADTLYVAIADGEAESTSCSGTFEKAKVKPALECIRAHPPSLLEYDFAVASAKDLAGLPPSIAKDKAKIDTTARSALMMIHRYEEAGRGEVVVIALVKGKGGKPAVSALWVAAGSTDETP